MDSQPSVFLVYHVRTHASGEEDTKMIGAYASRQDAEAAVRRLNRQPGFRDSPQIVKDGDGDGFQVVEYEIGKDHWTEGFGSAFRDDGT